MYTYILSVIMVFNTNSTLKTSDREAMIRFITEHADHCMLSIMEGKLAADMGTTEKVRRFGTQMVNDHERILDDLKILGAENQILLPEHLSETSKKKLHRLTEQSGLEFDRMFLRNVKRDHRKDIREFQKILEMKSNALVPFARRHLATEKSQLEQVSGR